MMTFEMLLTIGCARTERNACYSVVTIIIIILYNQQNNGIKKNELKTENFF